MGVPSFTAYRALFTRGNAQPGDSVFIHGATGAVGLSAVQFAKDMGLFVVGSSGSTEGEQLLRGIGCDEVVCHREEGYLDRLLEIRPEGFNLCLEMLANINLGKDLPIMARHGRVMVIGSRGEVNINPRDCMMKEVDVRGVFLFQSTPEELWRMGRFMYSKMENGVLRPFVGKRYALSDAPLAHDDVIERPNNLLGNIVLIPEESDEFIEEMKQIG